AVDGQRTKLTIHLESFHQVSLSLASLADDAEKTRLPQLLFMGIRGHHAQGAIFVEIAAAGTDKVDSEQVRERVVKLELRPAIERLGRVFGQRFLEVVDSP